MANTWYPVIDYTKCAECGICGKKNVRTAFITKKNFLYRLFSIRKDAWILPRVRRSVSDGRDHVCGR